MSILSRIHPDLTPILPGTGGKATPVSIAYRRLSKTRWTMFASFSKSVAYEMGFSVEPRGENYAEFGFDPHLGLLVVVNVNNAKTSSPTTVRWKGQQRQGTVVFSFSAPWMAGVEVMHSAEPCVFKKLDENIDGVRVCYAEIEVPHWAAPQKGKCPPLPKPAIKQTPLLLGGVTHIRPGVRA